MGRLQTLWQEASPPTLDARLSLLGAFAANLRAIGPANFLYADGDALFAHGHKRLQGGGPQAQPPGLWTLQRHCVPSDPSPVHEAGVAIAQEERVSLLIASVPLTDESWQPLADCELMAVRQGQLLAARTAGTARN